MSFVYLNGKILPEAEARVSVHDRAILFGDGAYETMRSYSGKFFRFSEHLRRLRNTVDGMGLKLSVTDGGITAGALELLEANGLEDARLRLTVTGGKHDGHIRLRRSHPPNLILTASRLASPPATAYRNGVGVTVSRWVVHSQSPLPRIKTTNRLMHLMAKEEALAAGAWDALFCDERGGILEGTATNVFFVIDGELRTAPLTGPLLAGVTRDAVLQEARTAGVACREDSVGMEDLTRTAEAFLTSTTIELLPVCKVGDVVMGTGKPGPVWRDLLTRYRATVASEMGIVLDALPGVHD